MLQKQTQGPALVGDISREKVFRSVFFPIWGRGEKINREDIKREKNTTTLSQTILFPFAELCKREVAAPSHQYEQHSTATFAAAQFEAN